MFHHSACGLIKTIKQEKWKCGRPWKNNFSVIVKKESYSLFSNCCLIIGLQI